MLLCFDTGVDELDQIIAVLLKTNMAVGGTVALMLDNAIPGTAKERGLLIWQSQAGDGEKQGNSSIASVHVYDLPFGLNSFSKLKCSKLVPFLPYYAPKAFRHDGAVNEVLEEQNDTSACCT